MPIGDMTSPEIERIAKQILDAAFCVHSEIGPGALESIYEVCLAHELNKRGLVTKRQVALPIVYDGIRFELGLRLDLVVEELVIIEVKAFEKVIPVHEAQCYTYLKVTGLKLCLLINFNTKLLKVGIKRIVH